MSTRRQWLTVTTEHSIGSTQQHIHPPETAEQYQGMLRRLREVGRTFDHGPGRIEYVTEHAALGVLWTSHTRMEWTDEPPVVDLGDVASGRVPLPPTGGDNPDPLTSLDRQQTTHPADGSPRWIVAGPLGSIVYDLLGNHLAVLDPGGAVIDSLCRRYADEARNASNSDDDVFVLLTNHYWTQLIAGGA